MNVKLKERVNSKRTKFTFIFAVFLSLFMGKTFAQDNQQPFDYTKTVWIIHVIEGSGIVYGRPEPEEYDPGQGLIYIYEILIKYVYSMQDLNASSPPSSLTVTHELILINGSAEQRLLIGDHWISDERSIAVMSEVDYNNLKEWLGTREKNQDYKKNPPIDKLVKAFRNGTSPEIESFDKYFHRNQTASDSAKTQAPTANFPEPFHKDIQANSEHESSQSANQDKTNTTVKPQDSIDATTVKFRFNANSSSIASNRSDSNATKMQTIDESRKFSLSFWLSVFIAPLSLLFFLLYRKISKRQLHFKPL